MQEAALIEGVLAAIPYAGKLGVTAQLNAAGGLTCTMPFHENHVGNKQLPALHGGSLASFLEITSILQLAGQQAAIQGIETARAVRQIVPLPDRKSVV